MLLGDINMHEKRISVRTDLLGLDAKVSLDGEEWVTIAAKDISDGGLRFSAEHDFPKGAQLYLKGSVSDFAHHADITCMVRIIFCGTTPEGERLYGIKFLDLDKSKRTTLSIFIERMVTHYPPLLLD